MAGVRTGVARTAAKGVHGRLIDVCVLGHATRNDNLVEGNVTPRHVTRSKPKKLVIEDETTHENPEETESQNIFTA